MDSSNFSLPVFKFLEYRTPTQLSPLQAGVSVNIVEGNIPLRIDK